MCTRIENMCSTFMILVAFTGLCFVSYVKSNGNMTNRLGPSHSLPEVVGGQIVGNRGVLKGLVRFNDSDAWNHGRITAIRMQCGQYLLAMQVQYNGVWASKHGFWNPKCAVNQSWTPTYNFGEGEWIERAEMTGDTYTSSITFTTNKRRLETCGIPVMSPRFTASGRLEYVSGVFGCYFDRLQLYWSPIAPAMRPAPNDNALGPSHPLPGVVGGQVVGNSGVLKGLVSFNDSDAWNHGRITAIRMQCGQYLLALQVQYNGKWAPKHGFWNNECAVNQSWTPIHKFKEGEWIERAEMTGDIYTSSITFTTNKQRLETCGVPAASQRILESGRLEYVSGVFGCYFDRLQLYWSANVVHEGQPLGVIDFSVFEG